jgi:hypothetical protein
VLVHCNETIDAEQLYYCKLLPLHGSYNRSPLHATNKQQTCKHPSPSHSLDRADQLTSMDYKADAICNA